MLTWQRNKRVSITGYSVLGLLVMSTILLLLMAGSAAAAPIKITIQGNAPHLRALAPVIEEYNAQQDRIEVSLVLTEISFENMVVKYVGGTLPDIIESGPRFTQPLAREGILADLTPYLQRAGAGFMQQFIPATMVDNQLDGRLYALPAFLQIEGMYYNPDILSQAGLGSPPRGWTWADLKAMAQKARRYDSEGKKIIYPLYSEGWFQADFPLLGQAGGKFVTDDYKVVINSQPVRDTFNWMYNMIEEDLLECANARGKGLHEVVSLENWYFNTAFTFSATYRQDRWNSVGANFVTAPPLRFNNQTEPSTRFTDRSWAITMVSPEQRDAAFEVIQYLLSPKPLAQWTVALGNPPATRGAISDPLFRNYLSNNRNMQIWVNEWASLPSSRAYPIEMEQDLYLASGAVIADLHTKFIQGEITLNAFLTEGERILQNLISDPERPWRHAR
ncbi:MAG TPA: extracellular solute-binding protein [Firmicutes bacterium]|nr:extracellular solute-binding protein [Bacillota bacterium]